jgi:inorganic pyrophosphatase
VSNDALATDDRFWVMMRALVASSRLVLDRPRGTTHPRYPTLVYPLDYGYLEGTASGDGEGIDVWVGSGDPGVLSAIVCTVDAVKRDAEIKLLLGCSAAERQIILALHNQRDQGAWLVEAPDRPGEGR